MADDSSLIIKINGDSKKFNDEIDKVSKKTEDLQSNLNSLAKVSGIAFAGLVASAGLAAKSFFEANKVSEELKISLQNQGIASQGLLDRYNDLATAIQNKTGVDDDAIKSGLTILQNFLGQTEASEGLTSALVNLAEKTGSVESAAEILGRGIAGNAKGLKQYGIVVDESANKQERIAAITAQVSQKFDGLAETANRSQGGFRGLNTQFGNLVENIGERLAPVISQVVNAFTLFFQRLNENKPLLDFIVSIGVAGTVISGLGLVIGAGGLAFLKFKAALDAAKIATSAMTLATRGLVGATGIGLLVIAATEIYLNWNKIFPVLQAIFEAFTENVSRLGGGLGTILTGIFKLDINKIKSGVSEVGEVLDQGFDKIKASAESKEINAPGLSQDPGKKAAAQKARDEEVEAESNKAALLAAQNELVVLQNEQASQRLIELKKLEIETLTKLDDEKYARQKESLLLQLEEIAFLQEENALQQEERQLLFNETLLINNDAFQELSLADQELFIAEYQSKIIAGLETEKQARQKFIEDQLNQQIVAHNRYLAEQQRYGTAYALINQSIQSNEVQGFARAASELAQLQQSKNSTLKAIGKAAAIADITIRTAQSAMAIFAGFSTIPFIGVGLGVAGAAAAIAFGAEKIANVTAAADGGIITGGTPGQDSVPAMLMPGELVVPTRNFSEVVNAVANQRAQQSPEATSGVSTGGTNPVSVTARLEFSGDGAEKFLTARQVEARSLGTFREAEVVA